MESLQASSAAEHWPLMSRDVKTTMQTEGPSSTARELADCVKDKTEGSFGQEVFPGGKEKGRMEMDDLLLWVKTKIKEEIEEEMRSSSCDCELPLQDVRVKDENAEEQHQNPKNSGYEVATEEMVPEKSVTAAKSQATAEPESKPAKRRRLTRRDVQKTMHTEGLNSAKKELPDGVKVKTERCAEQQVKRESPQKRMEMDDLLLWVKTKIKEEIEEEMRSSSCDCELPLQDVRVKDENAEEQHQNPKNSGYEVATEEMVPEKSMIPARSQTAAEPESKPAKRRRLTLQKMQAFASLAATWGKQCLAFRSSKTWSPTRPCCPANFFLGSAFGTPSPPPPDAPACVLRLTGHGLRCLQRFYDQNTTSTTLFDSEAAFCRLSGESLDLSTVEAFGPCLQTMPPKPPSDCDLQMQDYKVHGLDCMKMWPWMRDLPTSVWAGHGWAYDENGLRRLSSSGGSHAMQGVEVFESVGLAAEEVKPSDGKIKEAPAAVAAAERPPPSSGEQKPAHFKRINVAKQSGVPNVQWNNTMQSWEVRFFERDAKGKKTRTGRKFSVKNFMGPGISEAQADAAALKAAKAFHAELVEKGILSEPKPRDPNFTSEVPGVKWKQELKKWRVEIPKGDKKKIHGGYFTEKAAAEAKALELREKAGLQRQVKPVATLANRYAGLPVFHPKVPYPGVLWRQAEQQWHVQCHVRGAKINFRVRPKDHSEAELERSFQVAVAWKKKQEKEGTAVKSRVKPGKKRRK